MATINTARIRAEVIQTQLDYLAESIAEFEREVEWVINAPHGGIGRGIEGAKAQLAAYHEMHAALRALLATSGLETYSHFTKDGRKVRVTIPKD